MSSPHLIVDSSPALKGELSLYGAKNATLVIMASLVLTQGTSRLYNVPYSDDVVQMIDLLRSLRAHVVYFHEEQMLEVDTTDISVWQVDPAIMKKMRASILVMGPLLVRFGKAMVAHPGGCRLGARPIDFHLKSFKKMGVVMEDGPTFLHASVKGSLLAGPIIFEYPSVGATENIMMAAVGAAGTTTIVNASLEPEVLDLIVVLKKMGARITVHAPATIEIEGVSQLYPIEHTILPDRLEAGALLLAAAITGGSVSLPNARASDMDVFLFKLEEMGHTVIKGDQGQGVSLCATAQPQAVSFKTGPYPGFPTDLQAPMMAVQCLAQGTSIIEETVFENRLIHVSELQKMGAHITVEHTRAKVIGVDELYGARLIATDIRASCALVLAAMAAKGVSYISGVSHWNRGYYQLEKKLQQMGASIDITSVDEKQPFLVGMKDEIGKQFVK